MQLEKILKAGTTTGRKAFWDSVAEFVLSSQKKEGKNVSVNVHDGYGSIINVLSQRQGSGPPPVFVCDGSTSVTVDLEISVSGTCPSGMVFTTITPGTSGPVTTPFDTAVGVPVGTAEICNGASPPEITNGEFQIDCSGTTDTFPFFLSTLLGIVITAGTINGNAYAVGDWVLLVGSLTYDFSGIGTCDGCTGTFVAASDERVSPGSNVFTRTAGGVTSTITLNFSL